MNTRLHLSLMAAACVLCIAGGADAQQVAYGTYTGNGTSQNISVGFDPDWVIVKTSASVSGDRSMWKTNTMSGALSKRVNGTYTLDGNAITLGTNQFSVGTNTYVNANNTTFYYVAIQGGTNWEFGTYTGNGPGARTISLSGSFTPDLVVIMPDDTEQSSWRSREHLNTNSNRFGGASTKTTEIVGLGSGQFSLGTDAARVNVNNITYHYVAVQHTDRYLVGNSYTGNSTSRWELCTNGTDLVSPVLLWTKAGGVRNTMRMSTMSTSYEWRGPSVGDAITALSASNAFQLGTIAQVNQTGTRFLWVAIGDGTMLDVRLRTFSAARTARGTLLSWKTGYEVDTLGFHVYRRLSGKVQRLTRSPIAASGLQVTGRRQVRGATYAFWDRGANTDADYWLEEIELSGKRSRLRTVRAKPVDRLSAAKLAKVLPSPLLSSTRLEKAPTVKLTRALRERLQANLDARAADKGIRTFSAGPSTAIDPAWGVRRDGVLAAQTPAAASFCAGTGGLPATLQHQWRIAADAQAYRLHVVEAGWQQVPFESLGRKAPIPSASLRLHVDGEQVALEVNDGGDGELGPGDDLRFWGMPLDTDVSGTRIYWLSADASGKALRVTPTTATTPSVTESKTFIDTTYRHPRSMLAAGIINGEKSNFFGAVVTNSATTEVVTVTDPVSDSVQDALLVVSLQGGSLVNHDVAVAFNDQPLGTIKLNGRNSSSVTFAVPHALLVHGDNVVRFTGKSAGDVTLIDNIALSYQRKLRSQGPSLRFTLAGGATGLVDGFATMPQAYDVTAPNTPLRLKVEARGENRWAVRAPAGDGVRQVVALSSEALVRPRVERNVASSWHDAGNAAGLLAITSKPLSTATERLLAHRAKQGWATAKVDITDVYDEFSFGHKDPSAIRCLLRRARETWQRHPQHVLLVGSASVDPRGFLDRKLVDHLPTKSVAASSLETASDDWFADFDGDRKAELAIGRLPAADAEEADRMVDKLIRYDADQQGDWSRRITLISDLDEKGKLDFAARQDDVAKALPAAWQVEHIKEDGAMDSQLTAQLTAGQLIVSYYGHGSTGVWGAKGDESILETEQLQDLDNEHLPLVLSMTCLSGLFHSAYTESMAAALLKSPAGAVGVFATSSMGNPSLHHLMNQAVLGRLTSNAHQTVGQALLHSKRSLARHGLDTWVYLGDPSLRLHGNGHARFGASGDDPRQGVPRAVATNGDAGPGAAPTHPAKPPATDPPAASSGCRVADSGNAMGLALFLLAALWFRRRQ